MWKAVGPRGRKRAIKVKTSSNHVPLGRNERRQNTLGYINQRTRDRIQSEKRGREGGGYNKNGGAEPYQERETLSILYLNAQSKISKLNELQVVSKDLNPSIILVTESWCNNSIYDSTISIQGYELSSEIRKDRHDTRN